MYLTKRGKKDQTTGGQNLSCSDIESPSHAGWMLILSRLYSSTGGQEFMSHALRERGLVSMCWCECLIARLLQFFCGSRRVTNCSRREEGTNINICKQTTTIKK